MPNGRKVRAASPPNALCFIGKFKSRSESLDRMPLDLNTKTTAVVFFGGHTRLAYLKCLKPGFRHCFICIRLMDLWVIIDPMSDIIQLGLIAGYSTKQLCAFYEAAGYRSCVTEVAQPVRPKASWRLLTCVEVVKGLLGLRDRKILTPYQLYKYLKKEKILDNIQVIC